MREKRLLFIYNPMAGRGLIKANLREILDVFSATDYELIVHATQSKGDGAKVAYEYAKEGICDRIVCAGGDGTIDEVAGAIMKSGAGIPLGIIPAGSTNDFGYSLGLPADIIGAANAAVSGHEFSCDIAKFGENYYTYTAAFGLFSDASYDTPQNIKNAIGHAAYVLNGMTKLNKVKKIHGKVTYNGKTIEDEFLLGMVVSSNSVGGFKGIIGDGVKLDDGLHEVMLVRAPENVMMIPQIINEVISHQYQGKYFTCERTNEVHFEFSKAVPWSLDGEYGGSDKKANITVIKKGINYIVP